MSTGSGAETIRATGPACCPAICSAPISDDDAGVTAGLFKALSDPHRVRIVNLLATSPSPMCVCEVSPAIGVSQPTTSFHLKKLTKAGLLERERRGVWAYYSLNRRALAQLARVFDAEEAKP